MLILILVISYNFSRTPLCFQILKTHYLQLDDISFSFDISKSLQIFIAYKKRNDIIVMLR